MTIFFLNSAGFLYSGAFMVAFFPLGFSASHMANSHLRWFSKSEKVQTGISDITKIHEEPLLIPKKYLGKWYSWVQIKHWLNLQKKKKTEQVGLIT